MSNDEYQQQQFWDEPVKLGLGIYTQIEMSEFISISDQSASERRKWWNNIPEEFKQNQNGGNNR